MDYFDIFGENTTKLSTYEETYEPNLKLSTMLYESMLESLDADIAITEAMIRSDVTEIRFKRANVNEAALEALHEGVISKIWDAIVNGIKWLVNKVKAFFSMIFTAIGKVFKKIGQFFLRESEDDKFLNIKIKWYENTPDTLFNFVDKVINKIKPISFDLLVETKDFKDFGFEEAKKVLEEIKTNHSKFVTKTANEFNDFKTFKIMVKNFNRMEKLEKESEDKVKKWLDKLLDKADELSKKHSFNGDYDEKTKKVYSKESDRWYETEPNYDFKLAQNNFKKYKEEILNIFKSCIAQASKDLTNYKLTVEEIMHNKEKETNNNNKTNESSLSFDDVDLNNQYLDEQFLIEMSEYEIEQIFENTYTDNYGRIVCNF